MNKGIFFEDSTDYTLPKIQNKLSFKEKSEWTNYKKIRKMNKINNFLILMSSLDLSFNSIIKMRI